LTLVDLEGRYVLCVTYDKSLSVTGIRTLGVGRRRYGRLLLAVAGLLVLFCCY